MIHTAPIDVTNHVGGAWSPARCCRWWMKTSRLKNSVIMSAGVAGGDEVVLQHDEADRRVERTARAATQSRRRPARRNDRRCDRALKARNVTSSSASWPPTRTRSAVRSALGSTDEQADERRSRRWRSRTTHATRRPRRRPSAATRQERGEDDERQRRGGLDLLAARCSGCGTARRCRGTTASISAAIAATAMTSATIARWVRRPKSSCGGCGPASDEERSGEQADDPRDEVLDVPQQAGVEHHGDEVDAERRRGPGVRHTGCITAVSAPTTAKPPAEMPEVELAGRARRPTSSRCPRTATRNTAVSSAAEGLAADDHEQRPPVADAPFVDAGGDDQQGEDRDVERRAAARRTHR